MTLRHPFQKLCLVSSNDRGHQLLVAASGSTINVVSLTDDKLIYQWPASHEDEEDDEASDDDRPSKKRKVNSNGQQLSSRRRSDASDASIEIVAERKKGERKKSKIIDERLPNVSHLLATSDGKFVVAITAEDKAIRVFAVKRTGKLLQLSQRSLPKKLCALQFTKDEQTILTADKFGDVYAVPLHQSEGWTQKATKYEVKKFQPSASELTVHTKKNLEALRQQMELRTSAQKKEGPDFEHQLLLGHVSLLTDLAIAEALIDGRPRAFILTSDRDEHIRISRGVPQTHIIENYCLGHLDFVTKLCILPKKPEYLVAGNGEPSLRLYDWRKGILKQMVRIGPLELDPLQDTQNNPFELPAGRDFSKLAVSGIWPLDLQWPTEEEGAGDSLILVAIEGMPLLLLFILTQEGLTRLQTIEIAGNVLDIVTISSKRHILVSIDGVHEAYSMKSYRSEDSPSAPPFQILELCSEGNQANPVKDLKLKVIDMPFGGNDLLDVLPEPPEEAVENNTRGKVYEKVFSNLGEFLYGLENLRKKRDNVSEEEIAADGEDGDIV